MAPSFSVSVFPISSSSAANCVALRATSSSGSVPLSAFVTASSYTATAPLGRNASAARNIPRCPSCSGLNDPGRTTQLFDRGATPTAVHAPRVYSTTSHSPLARYSSGSPSGRLVRSMTSPGDTTCLPTTSMGIIAALLFLFLMFPMLMSSTSPVASDSAAASASACTTSMDASPSSSHRSRLPFSIVSVYSANPKAPNVATWHLCGPFFGGDEASAQVHPMPTRWRSPPRSRAPRRYAATAMSLAVDALTYCAGSAPRQSIMLSRAYGTYASMRVLDAPGTAITQPMLCAPPPVTFKTARKGLA